MGNPLPTIAYVSDEEFDHVIDNLATPGTPSPLILQGAELLRQYNTATETLTEPEKVIRRIEAAERMASVGSAESAKYLSAALMLEWPRIRLLLRGLPF